MTTSVLPDSRNVDVEVAFAEVVLVELMAELDRDEELCVDKK